MHNHLMTNPEYSQASATLTNTQLARLVSRGIDTSRKNNETSIQESVRDGFSYLPTEDVMAFVEAKDTERDALAATLMKASKILAQLPGREAHDLVSEIQAHLKAPDQPAI